MIKIPDLFSKRKICMICEGDEEYEYLNALIPLNVWSEKYIFVLKNAEGNGNISANYQEMYTNEVYDMVLVFCDTDKKPYEQYLRIKSDVNVFHGIGQASDEIIIFGNPCTMQIIIAHWNTIKLESNAKKVNAPIICKFTGIANYKGKASQRNALFSKISTVNYLEMKDRIKDFCVDDSQKGSTNFLKFLNYFTYERDVWIEEINDMLNA